MDSTDPEPAARRKWWRRAAIAALALPATLVVLVVAAYVLLQTDYAKERLAGWIADAASTPGESVLHIGAVEGNLPFNMVLRDVSLADGAGVWLKIDRASVDVDLAPLFSWTVRTGVSSSGIAVSRLPAGSDEDAERPINMATLLPDLPVEVEVHRLHLTEMTLGEAVAGVPLSLAAEGRARLQRGGGGAAADLDVREADGGTVTVSAALDPEAQSVDVALAVNAPRNGKLAALADLPDLPGVTLEANAAGTLADLSGRLALQLDGALPVDAPIPDLLGTAPAFETAYTIKELSGISLSELALTGAEVALNGDLSVALTTGALNGSLAYTLARLATLDESFKGSAEGDITLSGSLADPKADVVVRAEGFDTDGVGARRIDLTAAIAPERPLDPTALDEMPPLTADVVVEAEEPTVGDPMADALLGSRANVATTARTEDFSTFAFRKIVLRADKLSAQGEVDLDAAAEHLAGTLAFRLPDLGVLSAEAGQDLAGTAQGRVAATGHWVAPELTVSGTRADVTVDGRPLTLSELQATVAGLPRPKGSVASKVAGAGLDAAISTEYALLDDGAIRLDNLSVRESRGRVTGALEIRPRGGAAAGTLSVEVEELAPWSTLIGADIGGSLGGSVSLTVDNGRQGLTAQLKGARLSFGPRDGEGVRIGRLSIDGTLADITGAPAGTAAIAATDLRLPAATFDTADLNVASGNGNGLDFTLAAEGQAEHPVALTARGRYASSPKGQTLTVGALDGHYGDIPIRQNGEITVIVNGEDLNIAGVDLSLAGGRVAMDGRLAGDTVVAELSIAQAPLSLARLAVPDLALDGRLDATVTLEGSARQPTGNLSVAARGVELAALTNADLPQSDVDLAGSLKGGSLAIDGAVSGVSSTPFTVAATLPLRLSLRPFAFDLPRDGALSAKVDGQTELRLLASLVTAIEGDISGKVDVAATVDGTVGDPRVSGNIALHGGRFESFETGTLIENIEARVVTDGERLVLERLAATDGDSGTIDGKGTLALDGPLNLAVDLGQATLVRLDTATVTTSGQLTFSDRTGTRTLAGKLTVDKAELRIPDHLPKDHTVVSVDEVKGDGPSPPGSKSKGDARRPSKDADGATALVVDVSIPRRAFLRGRGLDSEWSGELHVGGTTDAPRIDGPLNVVRGTLDFLGRKFNIARGQVAFTGDAVDNPDLDFAADAKSGDIVAQVLVTGTAKAPEFALTSQPELPQDEVMSHLLFGKNPGQLSAAEAVQLAAALDTLTGATGSGSIFDTIRSTVGVDTFSIEGGGEGGSPSDANVSVGKYVADGVFLKVDKGLTGDSAGVGVEIEVTPNISIETDVDSRSKSNVGVNFKYDY